MFKTLLAAVGVILLIVIAYAMIHDLFIEPVKLCAREDVIKELKTKITDFVGNNTYVSEFWIKSTTSLSSTENQTNCLAIVGIKRLGAEDQHRVRYQITKDDQNRLSMDADVSPVLSMYLDPEDRR